MRGVMRPLGSIILHEATPQLRIISTDWHSMARHSQAKTRFDAYIFFLKAQPPSPEREKEIALIYECRRLQLPSGAIASRVFDCTPQ
jgi:hypothetical protein